jgi:hypothetical protein
MGAFLPGVSLAVLLTLFIFDSGQSGLIWPAFLLGILVGTTFSVTVAFSVAGRLGYRKVQAKREDREFEKSKENALKSKELSEQQKLDKALALKDKGSEPVTPRRRATEDDEAVGVIDPAKDPELAQWAQESGVGLELTGETLAQSRVSWTLTESSQEEPSIFQVASEVHSSRFAYVPKKLQEACDDKKVFYI